MIFTPRLQEAINLCARLHRDQIRKDFEQTPVITHPFSVMIILSEITNDEDILIAGLMHDTLEDVPKYSYERLVEDTNERVAEIVKGVTEELNPNLLPEEQFPWLRRKENYLNNLKTASIESVIVSVADKTHNIQSMLLGARTHDNTQFEKFKGSIRNTLWFFDEIENIANDRLGKDHILVTKMSQSLHELKEILK